MKNNIEPGFCNRREDRDERGRYFFDEKSESDAGTSYELFEEEKVRHRSSNPTVYCKFRVEYAFLLKTCFSGCVFVILRITCVVLLICWGAAVVNAANTSVSKSSGNSRIVTGIKVVGNRVQESVIRSELDFKEGDVLTDKKIQDSKNNLNKLGLFRKLEIREEADSGLGGVNITIVAQDGWFILPWPMFGSKGGNAYIGGLLLEQNMLKKAERILVFTNYREFGPITMASYIMPSYSVSALLDRRSYTEYHYADGGYNSQVFEPDDLDEISKFGDITNNYDKKIERAVVSSNIKASKYVKIGAGLSSCNVEYKNALNLPPQDAGEYNALHLLANFGSGDFGRDMLSSFGRIFGLGMADIHERIKPLVQKKTNGGVQLSLETSQKALGSDAAFNKYVLFAVYSVEYRNRSRMSLNARSGYGTNLPQSQLFATNGSDGLLGLYEREYRGSKIVCSSLSYRYPFSINRLGSLSANMFTEFATAFEASLKNNRVGAGFSLSYQFWRFPLPLGMGYTYSFDDSNWQTTFSVGGMF